MAESEPRPRKPSRPPPNTLLLHVNLPRDLVIAVRNLADEERRTITSQVALLLEESEELQEYIKTSANDKK